MPRNALELAAAIRSFVDRHAKTAGDYDPDYDEHRFNGPDPVCLVEAADKLERGVAPGPVHSEWGSGCYKPMFDTDARLEHDRLVAEANAFDFAPITSTKP